MLPTQPEGVRLAVSVTEAARMLGIGRSLAYKLVASGEIESKKVHGRRLISTAWLEQWAAPIQSGGPGHGAGGARA